EKEVRIVHLAACQQELLVGEGDAAAAAS
nr:hypothetical protein [Tanacetum cinerariifolium]